MSIKVTSKDVVWNYLGIFMTIGSNFIMLPFMMYFLNSEILGLWYVFLSIGGIVNLFDFGFSPTFARNVAYSWSGATNLSKTDVVFTEKTEPNFELLNRVIHTSKRIYLVISLIAAFVLLSIGTLYINSISKSISEDQYLLAWLIYCVAVFFNLYYGYYTTLLRGVGAISKINIANIISRTIQILISILLLYFGLGLIAVSLAYLFNGLIFRGLSKKYFYSYNGMSENLEKSPRTTNAGELKNTFVLIWHNAWRDGIVSLSTYLANQATVIISSIFLTLSETGVYSISVQLITAIATISGALYTAFQPSLQSAYINKNISKIKQLMAVSITMYFIVFWLGTFLLVTIGIPIISLIKTDVEFSIPIILAIAVYKFLLKHHSTYASYISNTNNVPYVKAFLLSGILGIVLSVVILKTTEFGVWGLIFAQIIAQGIYNNWVWPSRVLRSLDLNYLSLFKLGINELKILISLRLKRYVQSK